MEAVEEGSAAVEAAEAVGPEAVRTAEALGAALAAFRCRRHVTRREALTAGIIV
jgi:hypothetical protein